MTNGQLIQSLYDAFARGDIATVLGAFHPRIVFNVAENSPYADQSPYIGRERVAEGVFGRIPTEYDDFRVTPEKIIDAGDTVVALGRYRATYRLTGQPIDAQFAHVWTVQDGQLTSFQQYVDTLQFARARTVVVPPPTA